MNALFYIHCRVWTVLMVVVLASSMFMCQSIAQSDELGRVEFKASSDFGVKHFIVGFPHDQYAQKAHKKKEKEHPQCVGDHCGYVVRVLFSPDDDPRQHFIDLIKQEQKSIKIAIFNLTDPTITQALIDAKKDRNVQVQIIYEPSTSKERYSKIKYLKSAGVALFEYDPDYARDKRSNILHHKFTIFETAHNKQPCVWAGSLNLTAAASERNQEDIAIFSGSVVDRYNERFDCIKQQRCIGCRNLHDPRLQARQSGVYPEFIEGPRLSARVTNRRSQGAMADGAKLDERRNTVKPFKVGNMNTKVTHNHGHNRKQLHAHAKQRKKSCYLKV